MKVFVHLYIVKQLKEISHFSTNRTIKELLIKKVKHYPVDSVSEQQRL